MFFSVIKNNSNWETLTRIELFLKGKTGLNFSILGVHWKIGFLEGGGGVQKKVNIVGRIDVERKRGVVFLRRVDTTMHTMA